MSGVPGEPRPGKQFLLNLVNSSFRTFTELTPGKGMRPAFEVAVEEVLLLAFKRGVEASGWDRRTFQGTCDHPAAQRADAGGGLQACGRCGAVVAVEPPRKPKRKSHATAIAKALKTRKWDKKR